LEVLQRGTQLVKGAPRRSRELPRPETVVRWHRAGFALNCSMISKIRKRVGRTRISRQVRICLSGAAAENPTRGALRIHGELSCSASTYPSEVFRWMATNAQRSETRPSLRAVHNHWVAIADMDFFMVRRWHASSEVGRPMACGRPCQNFRNPQLSWQPQICGHSTTARRSADYPELQRWFSESPQQSQELFASLPPRLAHPLSMRLGNFLFGCTHAEPHPHCLPKCHRQSSSDTP